MEHGLEVTASEFAAGKRRRQLQANEHDLERSHCPEASTDVGLLILILVLCLGMKFKFNLVYADPV